MSVLAIDPGTERSAFVLWDGKAILQHGTKLNREMSVWLRVGFMPQPVVVAEEIESYGMPVGREVFETVFWTGRFAEACNGALRRLPRRIVKLHLCGDSRAKDANIRAALIDRFGGRQSIRKGGVLYGIHKDEWSALAIAVTWSEQGVPHERGPREPDAA
jgi:hypothetical protein